MHIPSLLRRPMLRLALLLLAAVTIVAACSNGSNGENTVAGDEADSAAMSESGDTAAADSDADDAGDGEDAALSDSAANNGTDDDGDGSLDDVAADPNGLTADEVTELLFGSWDPDDQDDFEAQYEQEERERQQVIVECMAAEGFEYSPVDYSQFETFVGNDIEWGTREYAETYGLGYSTFFANEGFFDTGTDFVDPNQEYIESLSPSAVDAYYVALYGDQSIFEDIQSEEEFDALYEENPELFEPQGCEGEAYRETSSFGQLDRVYAELGTQLDALYERVEADPRMVEVQQQWVECMAEEGYTFSTPDDMWADMDERMQPLYESQSFPGDDLTEEEFNALTDEERDALFNQPPEIDEDLLAEVQEYEIALALANHDCGGNDFEQFQEIFEEYQAQFVEENLGAIQALLAEDE